jgi:hypothetical protein
LQATHGEGIDTLKTEADVRKAYEDAEKKKGGGQ